MQRKEGDRRQRGAKDRSRTTQGITSAAVVVKKDTKMQPNAQPWNLSAGSVAREDTGK